MKNKRISWVTFSGICGKIYNDMGDYNRNHQYGRTRMYNNHDELYEEVDDFDEDIKEREALLEEAKKLQEASDGTNNREIMELKRRWKRIHYWDSDYEDRMNEEFEGYMDTLYAKRNGNFQSNQEAKEALIAQAKALLTAQNLNKATDEMKELMAQWKATGSAGRESDDALWEEFNGARQAFFDRKHAHWEEMQEKFAKARVIKQELITKAEAIVDGKDIQKVNDEFRTLMEEWKAAGSAGREHEDQLWEAFNAFRQKFFDRRSAYLDELHEEQDKRYQAKKALVKEARAIKEEQLYTKEATEKMKTLGVEWKKIGSCGKEKEDEIWNEFRTQMDVYFAGLKENNERRHGEWRSRMMDIRSRKLELIQKQKRQIQYMQNEIVGLLGQRAIDEMQEDIQDCEEFIKELEAEVADIDKRLEE